MKLIDIGTKGYLIRLYFTKSFKAAWGDDWDDRPYENKGPVYDDYVNGTMDIVIPYEYEMVLLDSVPQGAGLSWGNIRDAGGPVMFVDSTWCYLIHSVAEFNLRAQGSFSLSLGDTYERVKANIAKFNLIHEESIKII